MPTSVTAFYNGLNAFPSQTTPFMGLSETELYFNESWCKEETITLQGQLTGCTFDLINTAQANLISAFSANYKSFEIKQNNIVQFTRPCVQVESISFASQIWIGVLPYTITIKNYPPGFFEGTYGVLNPVDSWNYVEQNNEVMEVTHTISCVGFNTSPTVNNALDNAESFVLARAGTSSFITPTFIENARAVNLFLVSKNEIIDRFNGTYSLVERYSTDLTRNGFGILRYQTICEKGASNNLTQVSIQGEVSGPTNDIVNIRNVFNDFSPLGAASQAAVVVFGESNLNESPVTFSVKEDIFNGKIIFNYQFNDDDTDTVFFDYNVTMAQADGSRNTVTLDGQIESIVGDLSTRITAVTDYLAGINAETLFDIVQPFFNGQGVAALNPYPVSQSYSINPNDGTASVRIQFDDSPVYPGVNRFIGTINVNMPVQQIDTQPVLNGGGELSIVNLGYASRGTLNIAGTADGGNIQNVIMNLFQDAGVNAGNISLDTNQVTSLDTDNYKKTCTAQWSYDGTSAGITDITLH